MSGVHDIWEPFTNEKRPDLIVHDSRGFETGASSEVEQVQQFISAKTSSSDIENRLHVIWYAFYFPLRGNKIYI